MNRTEAVELASGFAGQKGYDPSQYTTRVVKKGGQWEVYFRRKEVDKPRPGDFFTVYLDDEPGSVPRIVYGK